MINTVILDFDGTIGDTCGLIVRTMQQTLDAVGLPMQSDAQCAAMIGLPLAVFQPADAHGRRYRSTV